MTETKKQYLEKFQSATEDVFHNAQVRLFPLAGVARVAYSDRKVFKAEGWEADRPSRRTDFSKSLAGEDIRMDSIRRAKKRVFEYAMLNAFEWFITWTLDPALVNRYNADEVSEKMRNFLRNAVYRKNLRYIIVPEYHKDGAIHAHGFVSGDLSMVNSGRKDKAGRTIYNVKDWRLGFSTAVRISGDYTKASYYITKYIEKADKMIFGNFYYAGGKGLIREPEKMVFDALFDEIEGQEYRCEATGSRFKYEEVKTDGTE